jgi:V8-like Glu-specific endopeptidase
MKCLRNKFALLVFSILLIPVILKAEPAPMSIVDVPVGQPNYNFMNVDDLNFMHAADINFMNANDIEKSISGPNAMKALAIASQKYGWKLDKDYALVHLQELSSPAEGSSFQINFKMFNLGPNSFAFIFDNEYKNFQRMTQKDLENYDGKSAFFSAKDVTLSVFSKDSVPFQNVEVESLRIITESKNESNFGENPIENQNKGTQGVGLRPETICGADDRSISSDRRSGRLMPVGCTGWLIGDGLALTAGHCIKISRLNFIEFQVPASQEDGKVVSADLDDQYPIINKTSIKKEYNGNLGHDWAVLEIGPNSNTGDLPGVRQSGHFKLSRLAKPSSVRITGFGVDDELPGSTGWRNKDNQTQQTHAGRVTKREGTATTGSYLQYSVDTMGGNSGSPIIDVDTDIAVGIHTNGGCMPDGSQGNHGTSADNKDLIDAIATFTDISNVYVD